MSAGTRNCDHCGESFWSTRAANVFCSIKCAAAKRWSDPAERARNSRPHSDASRAKMGASQRKRFERPEERQAAGARNRGRVLSPEHRQLLSDRMKGRTFTPEHLENLRVAGLRRFEREQPFGARAPRWRGDRATSGAVHSWLTKYHPKTGICEECSSDVGAKTQAGTHYAFRHHGQPYTRNRDDYRELCPLCHAAFDREWREAKRATA